MIKLYETDNFYLRPFTKEDITDQYLSWFADQEITKYTSHGLFKYTKEMSIEFLENADKNGDMIWAIIAKLKSTIPQEFSPDFSGDFGTNIIYDHIGNIALQSINWINRTAEFSGIIGKKKYWGKGVGTDTVQLLFAHGFNKLNLNRIYLGTAKENIGMRSIAEKLGMQREGKLRNHVFLNGSYTDIIQYGILKEEFNELQNLII